MSVVIARDIPAAVLAGRRERLLAMVDILEGVPEEDVRALARRSAFASLDVRDAVLVSPEEHEERLLLLLEGRAQVYEDSDCGQEMMVSVVEGGTLVGTTGFAPHPWGLRVEVLEPSVFCGVRRRAFDKLVCRYPVLGTRVASVLGRRLIETEGRLADLACKEVPERLASQILRLLRNEGIVTREGYKIPTSYTHRQLGTMIGAKREAVTRAFGKLRCTAGVELRDRRIFVTDPDALERVAQG